VPNVKTNPLRLGTDDKRRKGSASVKQLPSDPGFTWELFLITLLALGVVSGISAFMILLANGKSPGLLITLIALLLIVLALTLTPRLSNKYRARHRLIIQRADDVIRNDTRPPVLYLRSFSDDKTIARAIGFKSIEQEMKLVLLDIGPFIAFAEPNNDEPTDPGAARLYASQEHWKQKAREEMSKARLVIIRVGDSPSFWWEVEEATKNKGVRPEQLAFLIPPEKIVKYEGFRHKASEWLHCQLPEYKTKWSPSGQHGGILYFEPDGTPHFRKIKITWFRQTFWNLFGASLKIALRPVYEQLGVKWTKPPVQLIQVLYMFVLFFLAMLVVYYVYAMLSRLI